MGYIIPRMKGCKFFMSLYGILTIGENITSESTIGERASTGLQVMLIGMSVVFGVLVLLMAILYIFKAFAAKQTKATEPAAEPVSAPAVAAPAQPAGEDGTLVAVATAAIAAARGESDCAFNVISIKKIVK